MVVPHVRLALVLAPCIVVVPVTMMRYLCVENISAEAPASHGLIDVIVEAFLLRRAPRGDVCRQPGSGYMRLYRHGAARRIRHAASQDMAQLLMVNANHPRLAMTSGGLKERLTSCSNQVLKFCK